MLRYALSILDLRRARTRGGENAPPWENKSMYIFYIELLTGMSDNLIYRFPLTNPTPCRFPQAHDVHDVFHDHTDLLWSSTEHHP